MSCLTFPGDKRCNAFHWQLFRQDIPSLSIELGSPCQKISINDFEKLSEWEISIISNLCLAIGCDLIVAKRSQHSSGIEKLG
jgi:hypothetical protein